MKKTKTNTPFFSNTLHKRLNNFTMTYKKANVSSSGVAGDHPNPNSQLGVLSHLDQRQAIDIQNNPILVKQSELQIRLDMMEKHNHEKREYQLQLDAARAQIESLKDVARAQIESLKDAENQRLRAKLNKQKKKVCSNCSIF